VITVTDAGYLAQVHQTASPAKSATVPEVVVDRAKEQLIGLLDPEGARFEYCPCSATRRGWNRTGP
jgi:hypothetical protein